VSPNEPNRVVPGTVGALAGVLWLATFSVWLGLARPHWAGPLLAWFILLALIGPFLPGFANQATVLRAYLAGPALVYALHPSGLGGLAVTVALAGFSDLIDGQIARRLERPTQLGGGLDPVVDGFFFGAAAVGLVLGGALPSWLAITVGVRYGLPAVAGVLLLLMRRHVQLRHTPLGQVSTTVIALVLGGVALFRGLGVDASWFDIVGEIVIPVTTLGCWLNLAWANRDATRAG
jgi:cardiolipin synthase